MRRRLTIALVVLLALAAVTTVLWNALNWPPPRLLLKYGLPPAGGPTGTTKLIGGVEFAEVAPGYCWVERRVWKDRGDLLGQICEPLGLPWGNPPRPGRGYVVEWVEVPGYIWLSTHVTRPRSIEQLEVLSSATGRTLSTHWQKQGHIGSVRIATSSELYFVCETGTLYTEKYDSSSPPPGQGYKRVLAGPGWCGRDWSEGEVNQQLHEQFHAEMERIRAKYTQDGSRTPVGETHERRSLPLSAIHVWIPPPEPD